MWIQKDACEIHSFVLSVDPESALHWWKTYALVSANLRFIPDFACLSETFWDIQKSGLKTENGSEKRENEKLQEKKLKLCFKKMQFVLNFVLNLPTFLTNGLDQFQ